MVSDIFLNISQKIIIWCQWSDKGDKWNPRVYGKLSIFLISLSKGIIFSFYEYKTLDGREQFSDKMDGHADEPSEPLALICPIAGVDSQ